MYIFLTIAYLLSIVHINGLKTGVFFDETTYNPCETKSGLYFYPHPTDAHQYYQCDEAGNAYIRSCGDLAWDELRVACNWPSAVVTPSPEDSPIVTTTWTPSSTTSWSTTTASWPTTTPSWPSPTASWPSITPSWPTTTPSWRGPIASWPSTTPSWPSTTPSWPTTTPSWPTTTPSWSSPTASWPTTTPSWPSIPTTITTTTTTTPPSSTTDGSPLSLCKPINPCGNHGDCIESPTTVPSAARRFACICSENWFGRFCDKQIEELTTPPTMIMDQNKTISKTTDTFSLPPKTEKDSKLIFYGLKGSNAIPVYNHTENDISSPS